jgi:DNA polymerase-4
MRKIIHVDMDAFFASVEQRDDPALQGKAVVVGGKPDSRGVVAACSYEARKFGIHSAMPCSKAYKLCPQAIFVPPRFEAYREASTQIHEVFREFTDIVQPLSLDEAFLDVSDSNDFQGSATLIANQIRIRVKQKTNLTASAGVSYNKFLAKIASDMNKPDGLYLIEPEHAEAFIEQLDVRKFFGVGKVTEQKMHKHGIFTGKDLKEYSLVDLTRFFGKSGSHYYNISRGIDERPVKQSSVRKSIGKETTFSGDLTDKKEIWVIVQRLSSKVAEILLNKEMLAKTITLKVKYNDFQQVTRSKTLDDLICTGEQMIDVLPELLSKTEVGTRPIRLIGVSLSSLSLLQTAKNGKSQNDEQNESNTDTQLGLFEQ